MQQNDKELHEGLINAVYQLDSVPEGMGIFSKSATEGGGFYIDMGCAELLIRGDVMIRYDTVSRFEEGSVILSSMPLVLAQWIDGEPNCAEKRVLHPLVGLRGWGWVYDRLRTLVWGREI
eukprot:scaffold1551_cov166-Amphora_coffeaeformis.AAC.1